MISVALTPDDLARTVFTTSAVWDVTASLCVLANPSGHSVHRPLRRLIGSNDEVMVARLLELTRVHGWIPDTLAPTGFDPSRSALDQLQQVGDTSEEVAAQDLEMLRRHAPASRFALLRSEDFPGAVAEVMIAYWRRSLSCIWDRVDAIAQADIIYRQRQLGAEGLAQALPALHPKVAYSRSTMTVEHPTCDMEVSPQGQGIRLVPSVFRWPKVALAASRGPLVVSYPARAGATLWEQQREPVRELETLIGRSRAAILRDLDIPRTTTGLAQRLHLAPGTVSMHLSALAGTRLVSGTRDGRRVLYSRTSAGSLLLSADQKDLSAT